MRWDEVIKGLRPGAHPTFQDWEKEEELVKKAEKEQPVREEENQENGLLWKPSRETPRMYGDL